MDKEELIEKIKNVFQNVKLEDGIGLWEANGLDLYAYKDTLQKLKEKDERNDWSKISFEDFCSCNSSPSFFDAKGMLFHIPQMMILDIDSDEYLSVDADFPDLIFHLTYELDSDLAKEKLSLLEGHYAACIVDYLIYKKEKLKADYIDYKKRLGYDFNVLEDMDYIAIEKSLDTWKRKADSI